MDKFLSYLLLILAVFAISTSSPAFISLGSSPPPLKAAWRLQITTLALLFPFLYEYYYLPKSSKQFLAKHIYLPILAGLCYGVSFIIFNISLNNTSLAHSFLFNLSQPVVLVFGYLLLCKKVSKTDITGVFLGFIGMILISLDLSSSNITWYGDIIALGSCSAFLVYILIGKRALGVLKLPLWTYVIIVNATASLFCLIASGVIYSDWSYFGWMTDDKVGYALLLGLGPGLFGQTSVSYLSKVLRPVVITAFMNFEPLIGSIMGWIVGFQGIPGYFTWIGGLIMIIGNLVIVVFEANGQENQEKQENLTDLEAQNTEEYSISLLGNEEVVIKD